MAAANDPSKELEEPYYERRKEDKRSKQALILSAIALTLTCLVAGPLSGVSLWNSHRVTKNTDNIKNLERNDTIANRLASARQCERGNYTRAELHVAYLGPPASQTVIDAANKSGEPVLAKLLATQKPALDKSLKRVRTLNPILLCTPNLKGKGAKVLSTKAQKNFVEKYKKLELDPLPTAKPPK